MIHHLVGHPLTDQSSPTASDANTIGQYPSSMLSDYRDRDDTFSGKCHLIQISIFKCMSLFYHKELRKNNRTPSSAMHLKSIFLPTFLQIKAKLYVYAMHRSGGQLN